MAKCQLMCLMSPFFVGVHLWWNHQLLYVTMPNPCAIMTVTSQHFRSRDVKVIWLISVEISLEIPLLEIPFTTMASWNPHDITIKIYQNHHLGGFRSHFYPCFTSWNHHLSSCLLVKAPSFTISGGRNPWFTREIDQSTVAFHGGPPGFLELRTCTPAPTPCDLETTWLKMAEKPWENQGL